MQFNTTIVQYHSTTLLAVQYSFTTLNLILGNYFFKYQSACIGNSMQWTLHIIVIKESTSNVKSALSFLWLYAALS